MVDICVASMVYFFKLSAIFSQELTGQLTKDSGYLDLGVAFCFNSSR